VGTAGPIVSSYTYTASGRLRTATADVIDDLIYNPIPERYSMDATGNLVTIETEINDVWTTTSLAYTENRLSSLATSGEDPLYFAFEAGKRWRTGQAPSARLVSTPVVYEVPVVSS
jgi:hypothetical protein